MDSSKILCGLDTRHLGLQQGGYPFFAAILLGGQLKVAVFIAIG